MRDYELETIKAIRAAGNARMNAANDEVVSELWRKYSCEQWSAGWISSPPFRVADFIEWATTAPCDRKEDE